MTKKSKIIILNITEKCNSRCVMCGIWNKKNPSVMSVEKIQNFIKNNISDFNEVETLSFVGGEPFLHDDYSKFVKLYKYFPKLKNIGQPTNALIPSLYIDKIFETLNVLPSNIFYGISVSIDGIGQKNDKIRGIKNSFKLSKDFITEARERFRKYDNFYLTLTTTISKLNLKEIDRLNDFAKQMKLRIVFRPAIEIDSDYIDNSETSGWQFGASDRKQLEKEYIKLRNKTKNNYYDLILDMLKGEKRKYPCPFQAEGFVVNPDGELYMCLFSRQGRLGDVNQPLKELFYSQNYFEVQKKIMTSDCLKCSAECHTARSSAYKNNNYFEDQLELLVAGRYDKLKKNVKENKDYCNNIIINNLLLFVENKPISNNEQSTEEEKIIHNTFIGSPKYLIESDNRNNVLLTYNFSPSLLVVLLNLAKYYYIIKIYRETELYLRIINKYFQKEIRELSLTETIRELDNLIALKYEK